MKQLLCQVALRWIVKLKSRMVMATVLIMTMLMMFP